MTTFTRRRLVATGLATPVVGMPFLSRAVAADFILKVGHPLAVDHPTNVRLKEAAEKIAQDSGGRMELRIFPASQLGGDLDLLSQLRSGAIEVFVIGGLVVSSLVPMAALDGTGFVFNDHSRVWDAVDGKLGAHIRQALAQANLYATAKPWDLGFRQITSSVKPVRSVDDVAGMKIRIPGAAAYSNLFRSLGASPASVPFGEVYTALQTKIVDGQENPLSLIVTSRFYEVQKFCSLSNHIWQGNWLLINNRFWRSLPANLQEILETRLNEAGLAQRQDLAKLDDSYREAMQKGGMRFNDVDIESFRKKLVASGYYANARKSFGDAAWALLEEAAGGALG